MKTVNKIVVATGFLLTLAIAQRTNARRKLSWAKGFSLIVLLSIAISIGASTAFAGATPSITSVSVSQTSVGINQTFQVILAVQNTGSTAGDFDIQVTPTALIGPWTANTGEQADQSFNPGQTRTFSFTVTATSAATQSFLAQVRITGHWLWDGPSQQSPKVTAIPAIPTITSVNVSATSVGVNQTFQVTVGVQNTGLTAGAFDIQTTPTALIGPWTVNTGEQADQSFNPGQTRSFSFTVTATSAATQSFLAQVRINGHVLWDGPSQQSPNVTAIPAIPTITSVNVSATSVGVNQTFQVTVGVQNTGLTGGVFDIQVTDTALLGGWQINTPPQLNQSFNASQTQNFTFDVTATSAGTHSFLAQVRINGHLLWDGVQQQTANVIAYIPPSITIQPQNQSAAIGGGATFTVTTSGSTPLTYQWLRNGTPLSDGNNIAGSTTPALIVSNVGINNNSDQYEVLVSNPIDSVASSNASLRVVPLSPIYVTTGGTVLLLSQNGAGGFQTNNTFSGNNTGLNSPGGVAVDSQSNLYVANYDNNTVTVYRPTSSGNTEPWITLTGNSSGLSSPIGLVIDNNNVLYVVNNDNSSVTEYNIMEITASSAATINLAPFRTITSSHVTADPKDFDFPRGIAVDSQGKVYVSSYIENWVNVYSYGSSGTPAPFSTLPGCFSEIILLNNQGTAEEPDQYAGAVFGLIDIAVSIFQGTAGIPGQPTGIAIDPNGYIYVANQLDNNIVKFSIGNDGSSNVIGVIAGPQTGLFEPSSLAIDSNNCLYVANCGNPSSYFPAGTVTVYDTSILGIIESGTNAPVYNLAPIATVSNLAMSVATEGIIGLTLANPPPSTLSSVVSPTLKIAQVGDTITLNWIAVPGYAYQIQSAASLTAGNWQNENAPVIATGDLMSVSYPIDQVSQQYFRLLVQMP